MDYGCILLYQQKGNSKDVLCFPVLYRREREENLGEHSSPAHALPEAVEPPPGECNHGNDGDHQQHAAGNDIDDLQGLVPEEEVIWLHCQSMN